MTRHPASGSRRVKAQPLRQPPPGHGGGSFCFDGGRSRTSSPQITHQLQSNHSGQPFRPILQASTPGHTHRPVQTSRPAPVEAKASSQSLKSKPQAKAASTDHNPVHAPVEATASSHSSSRPRVVPERRLTGVRSSQPQPQARRAPGAGRRRLIEPTVAAVGMTPRT